MPPTATALVSAAREGLAELGDPGKAPDMRRYMKSELPFRGVQKPARERLAKRLFTEFPLPDRESWLAAVTLLWREAAYREERYLAIDLTGHRAYARWQTPDLVPVYEELVITGAWWDYVDVVAPKRLGPILRDHPATMAPLLREWAVDADRWKRRSAVICQLGLGGGTDAELLAACVEATIDDPDFFLRKGIGWALRQYARTDPGWVGAFVAEHPGLSPLSRKEALKHLGGK
ncbi:DNA alkylation repair protein [Prauserella marina]|uniref:3-methyladenine DNA glycosylase AlkD n=1 Tax=Prauserella marina TaxID=530584 RepID=A0A222VT55_9PSEU|nr:DNA alkylation repair protein [Prauserella marina]ASR37107.1 DNA alkylation repair protein [Prauserella marina]PWV72413.1 3-methyladenine DNA glycosylase AlkD [Prauserella marina]SDD80617.1 3-methyladenine DNA glycosylase AlkD [Prauserella marina]